MTKIEFFGEFVKHHEPPKFVFYDRGDGNEKALICENILCNQCCVKEFCNNDESGVNYIYSITPDELSLIQEEYPEYFI